MHFRKKIGTIGLLLVTTALSTQQLAAHVFSGAASNKWNDEDNWSNTPGIPNSSDDFALFYGNNTGSLIDLDGGTFELQRLIVWDDDRRLGNGNLIFSGINPYIETDAALTLAGTARATSPLLLRGGGSLSLDRFEGDIHVDTTTIRLGGDATEGIITGTVDLNAAAKLDVVAELGPVSIGALSGSGTVTFEGNNELAVGTGDRSSAFEGQIVSDTGAKGVLRKVGRGTFHLDELSVVDGVDIALDAGTLKADGTITNGSVVVSSRSRLEGHGSLSKVMIDSGGIFAPTSSVGSQMVISGDADTQSTDLKLGDGSIYEVGSAAGSVTSVMVNGKAEVGAVKVSLRPLAGAPIVPGAYEILTATDGVVVNNGGFVSQSAFLSAVFDYSDSNKVIMELGAARAFATAALTQNHLAVANALQSLDANSPIYQAVLLSPTLDDARNAFGNLSGETHLSAMRAVSEASGQVRQIALDRLTFDLDEDVMSMVHSTSTSDASSTSHAVWSTIYGERFNWDEGRASSGFSGGFAVGVEGALGNWRVGAFFSTGQTGLETSPNDATVESDDYGFSLYGGTRVGTTAIKVGLNHTVHDLNSVRSITVPGIEGRLTADYDASTDQVFAEVSHDLYLGGLSFSPFIGAGIVRQAREAFVEEGGVAALTALSEVSWGLQGTVGLRASATLVADEQIELRLNGGAAYHLASAEPSMEASFGEEGQFSLKEVSGAQNAVMLDLGLALDVGNTFEATVAYEGAFGRSKTDQGLKGQLMVKF